MHGVALILLKSVKNFSSLLNIEYSGMQGLCLDPDAQPLMILHSRVPYGDRQAPGLGLAIYFSVLIGPVHTIPWTMMMLI